MKTNNLFAEYVAPEVEVLSMVVEQGFSISVAEIDDWGTIGEDDQE